jgi:hypothetical protein
MSLTPYNVAGTLPNGTQFPATPQGLLNLIAQYMAIEGLEGQITINFGDTTPGIDERDRPWFKTDNNGVPIGWFSWNGSDWQQMPVDVVSGDTASRPAANQGQLYFDEDINCLLVYDRAQWRTADGSPGDVKFVRSCYNGGNAIADPSIAQVLTANPGWEEYTPMRGRGAIGTGTGSGLTERTLGELVGAEAVVLTEAQLAEHAHTVAGSARISADGNVSDPAGIIASYSSTTSGSAGSGEAHPNMQPSLALHCVWKL